jgi:hypothetical protein
MPEMQKPVLEHAAPKANQNQGLDSHLADEATALMQKADEFSPSDVGAEILYDTENLAIAVRMLFRKETERPRSHISRLLLTTAQTLQRFAARR